MFSILSRGTKTLKWRQTEVTQKPGKEKVRENTNTHTHICTNIKCCGAMFSLLSPKDALLAEARCLSP